MKVDDQSYRILMSKWKISEINFLTFLYIENIPILAARSTVEINQDFDSVLSGPLDSLLQVWKLTLTIGLPRLYLKCPVSDRNSHMVQSSANQLSTWTFIKSIHDHTRLAVCMQNQVLYKKCSSDFEGRS